MAVRCPVPSQESAYRYVNSILDRSEGFLSSGDSPAVMLGGHSKGGNMAVYAAMRIAHDDIEVAGGRAAARIAALIGWASAGSQQTDLPHLFP